MRLDKFLKVSRLIKRRTVANEACDAGRVLVNGSVWYKNCESRSPGYSGDDEEGRGERLVQISVINAGYLSYDY